MNYHKDGGPARPLVEEDMNHPDSKILELHYGMSKLDEFARSAMQGYLTNSGMSDMLLGRDVTVEAVPAGIARLAYDISEAMLEESKKRSQ